MARARTYPVALAAMAMLVLLASSVAHGQPEFFMRDTTVTECEGVLFDSELGELAGHYDHDEDYAFTICIAGADEIVLDFTYFHTEERYDEITFHDGPDASAPLIAGPYSGRVDIPAVVASSGCLTVRFASDANVAEPGWRATWRTSNLAPPTAPELTVVGATDCPLAELELTLDRPVACDSLYPAAVRLIGPKLSEITAVTPLDCSGGLATRFRVAFAPALDFGGDYRVRLRTVEPYCASPYVLYSDARFRLRGCPLSVALLVEGADELCAGETTRVRAEVAGGLFGTYQYTWSPSAGSDDTVRTGPITGPTTIRVEVVDAAGNAASAEVTIEPQAPPVIVGGDRSMCQSVGLFELEATPPGGRWSARGLYYGYDRYRATYDPLLTDGVRDVVTYEAPNGCTAAVTYTFTPLDVGTDDGACPGANPFAVSGGLPDGGEWSGPHVDAAGLFTPPGDTGRWTVTYTHPNGCAGSKEVVVQDAAALARDTFCESAPRVELDIEPAGGVWSGNGVTFGDRGWFSPGRAGPGAHVLNHAAAGCGARSVEVFVKEIDAFEGFTACPTQAPFALPGDWRPAGGTWYGRGVVDPAGGLFDPGLFGRGSDTLTYHAPNGCSDRRTASVFFTFIRPQDDTLELCSADAPVRLSEGGRFFQRPLGGTWRGAGVRYVGGEAFFDPAASGTGIHGVEYLANDCSAYVAFRVGQSPGWTGDTVCVGTPVVQLASDAPGTLWAGPGIVNSTDGLFDESTVGSGRHSITAVSPEGCEQVAELYVPEAVALSFDAPEPVLCFGESPLELNLRPTDARVDVDGAPTAIGFSAADLGAGTHDIELRAGEVGCEDVARFSVEVLEALRLSAKPYTDVLCEGEGARVELETAGGIAGEQRLRWSDLPDYRAAARTLAPITTTTYRASLWDGCSDSVSVAVPITVHPAVRVSVEEGPTVCHDETTYAAVDALRAGADYRVEWLGAGEGGGDFVGAEYAGAPGVYDVRVTDAETGCADALEVRLPGWPVVAASISANPADCVAPAAEPVALLDRSRGAVRGTWTLPDGSELPYVAGEGPALLLPDTGTFRVTLALEGEGGCTSRDSLDLCAELPTTLFFANAFTPNGDGLNDVYRLVGQGIYGVEWVVVDRWGTVVFEGASMDDAWDGTYRGAAVAPGRYTVRVVYVDAGGARRQAQGVVLVLGG